MVRWKRAPLLGYQDSTGRAAIQACNRGDGATAKLERVRRTVEFVNVGDIAHTPGVLAVLEKNLPGADLTLWPASALDRDVEPMLPRRFPGLRIVKGSADGGEVRDAFRAARILIHGSAAGVGSRRRSPRGAGRRAGPTASSASDSHRRTIRSARPGSRRRRSTCCRMRLSYTHARRPRWQTSGAPASVGDGPASRRADLQQGHPRRGAGASVSARKQARSRAFYLRDSAATVHALLETPRRGDQRPGKSPVAPQ